MEEKFSTLCSILDKNQPVLVQTHDFPDHDAIGAAYALSKLLENHGYTTEIAYGGLVQSLPLIEFVKYLNHPLLKVEEIEDLKKYQVIIVDGSPFKATVSKVAGILKAVIDHHPPRTKSAAEYMDIRPEMGACCSIIWSYWKESGKEYDGMTATAMIAGIQLDTSFLTRRVNPLDMDAYYELYFKSDVQTMYQMIKTTINIDELEEIGRAFTDYFQIGNFLLVELGEDYSRALLSVLADFLIWIKDISFVIVIETSGTEYKLSARSRDKTLDAGYLVKEALNGIGSGGGHAHMAGGVIQPKKYPGKKVLLGSIVELANSDRKESLWTKIMKKL
ncbi:DHH family phosphoesterase [Treponema sp. OMZ 788]|uniref:DHH family phosphoesterase n=1 Tax=unclassified Treponema TaxID=2638727 RepID=UPI0020A2B0B5|nr:MULTISPECIES: DHHA1 domain-containing protein [unclassified Treponema]UTC62361.1 DHH family phosphoesterase [Treponema sp. OMZ 787]UTC64666.1 DHH family phosphoesterase [Treponema sp. OMZ 788]